MKSQRSLRFLFTLVLALSWAALSSGALFAQDAYGGVATNDDYDAALLNPAALAVGNASGFGLDFSFDAGDELNPTPDRFDLFFNALRSSYVLSSTGDRFRHTFAFGVPVGEFVNLGSSYQAVGGRWNRGNLTGAALFRPLSFLSLGGVAAYSFDTERFKGRAGFGFRPLLFSDRWAERLTLYTDVSIREDESEIALLGVRSEPINGLRLRVGYAPPTSRVRAELSVALDHVRSGARGTLSEGSAETLEGFAHLSEKRFRSLRPGRATTYAAYQPGPSIVAQRPFASVPVLERYGDGQTVFEVIEEIRRLQEDPTVAGIVFRNVNLDASFSDMLEIRDALQRFREAGKQVVFYYESVGNLNYALAASVADKIYLSPAGSVGLTGIGSTTPYIKNLLDRIGVEVVNVSVGEYKSAGNLFSESEMPESEREARRALLEDQSEELRRMVRDGRGDALEGSVDDIVNDGPYLIADRALDAGLVDKLVYEDQLGDELSRITPGAQIEEPRFTQEITYDWQTPNAAQVALIVASGPIQSGEIDPTVGIGSGTVKRALSKARRDGSIQGVLLRVDSGGGSVLASDVIAREVRRLASQKPVVVSMGATAASGGYYIAAPATEIVAQPVTVTGSIGTVALLPNASALSQRLGIGWEQILIGENAAFASPVEPLDEEERERIRAALESRYSSFLELVAEERGMSMDAVEEAAQGRIWSGTQAAELGLVDELGGVTEARERLSELIDTERVELVPITGRRGLFDVPPATRLMTELAPTPVPAALSESVRTIRALTGARMHYVLLDPPHLRE